MLGGFGIELSSFNHTFDGETDYLGLNNIRRNKAFYLQVCHMQDIDWHCPALEKRIPEGMCWEYAMANRGGPPDALKELEQLIQTHERLKSLDHFQSFCQECQHKPW